MELSKNWLKRIDHNICTIPMPVNKFFFNIELIIKKQLIY